MIEVRQGDCVSLLRVRSGPLFDACICDPPYELGFMRQAWDRSGVAFQVETWRSVFDQLKPDAHLVAFSGTRTRHRAAYLRRDRWHSRPTADIGESGTAASHGCAALSVRRNGRA